VQSRKNYKLSGPDRLRVDASMPDVAARAAHLRSVMRELG
jgi:transcription-repair coupling factor (superfamily II helicase)